MGWNEIDLFKCSPEGFYWISQGYFDKEETSSLVMRKVAQLIYASNGGKPNDFDKFWPLGEQHQPDSKTWGTKEEAAEMIRKIQEAHKIKIKTSE